MQNGPLYQSSFSKLGNSVNISLCEILAANNGSNRKMLTFDKEITKAIMLKY